MINFEALIKESDVVFTGEGSFDEQSLNGKVISGIKKYNPKRMIIVCGKTSLNNFSSDVYPIVPSVATVDESMANPRDALLKLLKTIKL